MRKVYVLFHTHFGSVNFEKKYGQSLENFALKPTPRKLSSSCGVCAHFSLPDETDFMTLVDDHVANIYEDTDGKGAFKLLY